MRRETILKHDTHVQALVEILNRTECKTYQNLTFLSKRRRLIAEVDLLIERKDKIEVYEVKCSHRITKAQKQLYKIRKLLEQRSRKPIELFFYCGNSQEIVKVI